MAECRPSTGDTWAKSTRHQTLPLQPANLAHHWLLTVPIQRGIPAIPSMFISVQSTLLCRQIAALPGSYDDKNHTASSEVNAEAYFWVKKGQMWLVAWKCAEILSESSFRWTVKYSVRLRQQTHRPSDSYCSQKWQELAEIVIFNLIRCCNRLSANKAMFTRYQIDAVGDFEADAGFAESFWALDAVEYLYNLYAITYKYLDFYLVFKKVYSYLWFELVENIRFLM